MATTPGPTANGRDDDSAAVRAWIRATAWPLTTLDPGAALDDIAPLRDVLAPAAVVGLGESIRGVRGGHELYRLKHRIVRLAVETAGFRAVAVEDDDAVGAALDHHLRTGEGDARALLAQAWRPWQTEEFLDLLQWLRVHNASHPDDPVRMVGVDGPEAHARAHRTLAWHERTGTRTVYWGGMAHTARGLDPPAAGAPLGSDDGRLLRRHLAAGYVSVGLTCRHGAASGPDRLPPPAGDFAESELGQAGLDRYLLDLAAPQPEAVRRWLSSPASLRVVGPRYDPDDPDDAHRMTGGSLGGWFDVIGHVDRITPVRHLA